MSTVIEPAAKVGPVDPEVKRTAYAIGTLFFVNGAVFSNWLPRIPEVRERLGVDNRGLGAALIGGGLGGLVGSFLVAVVLARFGSRRVVLVAASTLAVLLPVISVVPSAFALAALLTTLGFFDILNDMAMNSQGVTVQMQTPTSIMHRLHGAWSLGFLIGSGVGSLAAAAKVPVGVHLSVVAVLLLAGVASVRSRLIKHDPAPVSPSASASASSSSGRSRLLSPYVLAMAVMAVGVAWLEAVPLDWSAVAMRDLFSIDRLTGLGTFTFACAMFIGRLNGDRVLERVGVGRLLDGSLAVSLAGAAIVVVSPNVVVALLGFAVWGLGASVMFPQLYTMAGNLPGSAAGAGLGAMAVGQRLGFMAAPPIVGSIARQESLRWSFAAAACGALVIVLVTRRWVRTAA
jgi:predicted MFS family arabinose efflux permease